jgi:hypothetical protein
MVTRANTMKKKTGKALLISVVVGLIIFYFTAGTWLEQFGIEFKWVG